MPDQEPDNSLVSSVAAPQLADLPIDVSEAAIDRLLDDGVLKDVPVVRTLIGVGKTVANVSNLIFLRKILRFLRGLGKVPQAQRVAFVARLNEDPGERRRVGEKLILLLDRLDDLLKPDVLARFFGAYVSGHIDYSTFQRLAAALERLGVYDLPDLRAYYSGTTGGAPPTREVVQQFAYAGLASIWFGSPAFDVRGGFGQNDLGKLFVILAFPSDA